MPNIIDLILKDHRTVEALFDRFNQTAEGAVAATICRELNAHSEAEELVVYPALSDALGIPVDELYYEQSHAKAVINRALQSEGAGLIAILADLEASITDHVAEEEQTFLPQLSETLTVDQLNVLGAKYLAVKLRLG
jgi:hemerythrin superfamily protein